jgi:hypothetical protein
MVNKAPAFSCIVLLVLAGAARANARFDVEAYRHVLKHFTREVPDLAGTAVDYAGLSRSVAWRRVVASLSEADTAALSSSSERLSFWINAYNILAIDFVVRSYPIASIRNLGSILRPVWDRQAGVIGGRPYTLNFIEHEILRPMGEPRVHGAIVCASRSCPSLRRSPYEAPQLEAQLSEAMTAWLADPRKGMRIDPKSRTVFLSRIFEWFAADFSSGGGVLEVVSRYAPETARTWLKRAMPDVRVKYLDYDWGLNDWPNDSQDREASAFGDAVSR